MRIGAITGASVALALASVPTAHAWGAAGHEIIATIAQMYLHPDAHAAVCDILGFASADPQTCHIASIATWADRIRMAPGYRWSASLHYVGAKDDYPSSTCAFPGPAGWAGRAGANVLGATRNVTSILEEYTDSGRVGPDPLAEEALKFLVHFVGDMHMPLHLTGRDRGGNSVKVAFDGRVTNLHSLWDSRLIAKSLRSIPQNYTVPLPDSPDIERHLRGTIYDPYIRRVVWDGLAPDSTWGWADEVPEWLTCPTPAPPGAWESLQQVLGLVAKAPGADTDDGAVCPYHWSSLIHPLNCEIIWPKALDHPTPRAAASDAGAGHACGHDHTVDGDAELRALLADMGTGADVNPRRPSPYIELDTPEYAGAIAQQLIIERLMAQGGVRLAAILNWLFVSPEARGKLQADMQ